MTLLVTVAYEAPADLPALPYNAVHHHLEHLADSSRGATWRQFAGGWNAVAYRFQACAEHDEAFRADFSRFGANTAGFDRYRQQRDVYGCVVNACSVIEAFYYSAHAIGSLLDPTIFPMDSVAAQREVTPGTTLTRYERAFPGDQILVSLHRCINDAEWSRLNDIRNVLLHRAAWAKDVVRSMGHPPVPATDSMRLSDYGRPRHRARPGSDQRTQALDGGRAGLPLRER